ncbi:MAG: T9SS type A sorting domain-containing protein [Calditrichaeota bacterium]|nr:T9SS type A sorting domain-containing protein [Calditrichota bacterium]
MKIKLQSFFFILVCIQFWNLPLVYSLGKSHFGQSGLASEFIEKTENSQLILTRPNGGENWLAGSVQSVHWNSDQSVGDIRIDYSLDAGKTWQTIRENVQDNGRYDFVVPEAASDSVLIKIQSMESDSIFDISDSVFSIFRNEQISENTCIPRPVTLTIDDVGWKLGRDDSDKNGPYRLGVDRDPVYRDYEVLVYVAQKVGTRLSARFVISEFDRENILAHYPTTNEWGSRWDNSNLIRDDDFKIMNFIKENSAWLELGIHGVRHEYWDWNHENGKMIRTEFYDEIHNKPWPIEILRGHLLAFQSILSQYGIHSFPESYTTPGDGYCYQPDSEDDSGVLFHSFGVKYAITDMIQTGNYGMPKQAILDGGIIDNGVLLIQQSRYVENWPRWNAMDAVPSTIPEEGIPLTHWPNWWAQNPENDFQVGDRFVNWFHLVDETPNVYVPRNMAQYYSQWLYRKYCRTQQSDGEIVLDNQQMPDAAYRYQLLGNLVLKIKLQPNGHIQQATIDHDAEVVGYYEKEGFAYLFLSTLKQDVYHLTYTLGSQKPPIYIWNDGTYTVREFKTARNGVYINLEWYGQQDIKVKIPFHPDFVSLIGDSLTILHYSYDETQQEITVTLKNNSIVGRTGALIIGKSQFGQNIAVIIPNGGEKFERFSSKRIVWADENQRDKIQLDYSPDRGSTWCTVATNLPNTGEYIWHVPSFLSSDYLIRIKNVTDGRVLDVSDSSFSVIKNEKEPPIKNVLINEIMTNNRNSFQDPDGDFSNWVEIYNPNDVPINLWGYFLSDDSLNLKKWRFPCVDIDAHGHLVVWVSGKDTTADAAYHTNFVLDTSNAQIYLSDDSSKIVDRISGVPKLNPGVSFSRIPDGAGSFEKTSQPTPGNENIFRTLQVAFNGALRYYSNGIFISGAGMVVTSNGKISKIEPLANPFYLGGFECGATYSFLPYKKPNASDNSAITMYDAALAARYSVGLDSLSWFQRLAADATRNNDVMMYDASIIGRYTVGLAIPTNAHVGEWRFYPDSLIFDHVGLDEDSVNFVGYLIGDVSGNWSNHLQTAKATLLADEKTGKMIEILADTLILKLGVGYPGKIRSLDFDLSYPENQLKFMGIEKDPIAEKFRTFLNNNQGRLRFGAFNLQEIIGGSTLFKIKFLLLNKREPVSNLFINSYRINDGLAFSGETSVKMFKNGTSSFKLLQNYPNPFNGVTEIDYSIPQTGDIVLTIFNSMGEKIIVFSRKNEEAGQHCIFWNGRNKRGQRVPSGIYFIELKGHRIRKYGKMILLN